MHSQPGQQTLDGQESAVRTNGDAAWLNVV